ncbi:hypothetical protein [Nostoc sp. FACHB-857]|uniref:Uncharacterized protein n=1 Tax=Nostoc paludosum FACHB-159 TaxID=2692908 RepID=A0ABR8KMW2_9NOSO|nr:hypothetical protein [Nostoc sp. FACHB-857]MBD2682944.1 hypothetical protein [Nostoc sp. FACHB-857]MBD2739283.1 hypothetical protein [Nostoc paludosum FACHB-159]
MWIFRSRREAIADYEQNASGQLLDRSIECDLLERGIFPGYRTIVL